MPEYRQHKEPPWDLEPYYCRHVSAMTSENLHSKAEIAEELAVRDKRIAELEAQLGTVLEDASEALFVLWQWDADEIEHHIEGHADEWQKTLRDIGEDIAKAIAPLHRCNELALSRMEARAALAGQGGSDGG